MSEDGGQHLTGALQAEQKEKDRPYKGLPPLMKVFMLWRENVLWDFEEKVDMDKYDEDA